MTLFSPSLVHGSLVQSLAFVLLSESLAFSRTNLRLAFKFSLRNNWVFTLFLSYNWLNSATSTRRLTRSLFNPCLSYELLHKLRENFVEDLRFPRFNTFFMTLFGSPRLPNFLPIVLALLRDFVLD